MKVQLLAASAAAALLFASGAWAQTTVDVNAAVSLGLGNSSAQGNTVPGAGAAGGNLSNHDNISGGTGNAGSDLTSTTVPGDSSAGGDLTSRDNVSISGGTGNAGDDLTNVNRSNSGTQASNGSTNNSGAYAAKGGNTGTNVEDGGVLNSGTYAAKGGNTGTNIEDGGVLNSGNNAKDGSTANSGVLASKGGTINSGAGAVGGDATSNFDNGAKTWNVWRVSSDQDLNATVSMNRIRSRTGGGAVSTGGISMAESGFAGVQTVSNNTGLMSSGQAATSVSANANITFGNVR